MPNLSLSYPHTALSLSIIAPLYNEVDRLPGMLLKLGEYGLLGQAQILLVDNASTDGTLELAQKFAAIYRNVWALHIPTKGKGAAVRFGMLMAETQWRMMIDCDLAVSPGQLRLMFAQRDRADILIASRYLHYSERRGDPYYRAVMGVLFRWLVRTLALPGISDSQCGFKLFSARAAEEIFSLQTLPGFAFDVEILRIAQGLGYRILECPVSWEHDPNSRVHPIHDSLAMLRDVIAIRRNERAGLYRPNLATA